MSRFSLAPAAVVLLLVTACTAPAVRPQSTPAPSPVIPSLLRAATVSCVTEPEPLTGEVAIGGVGDAAPSALAASLTANPATTTLRAVLTESSREREQWLRNLLSSARSGRLVVVLQKGEFQRASAPKLADAGATIVLTLPADEDPVDLSKLYPEATLFVATGATSDSTAALSAASAGEIASVLRGTLLCKTLEDALPSASPPATPADSGSGRNRACGPSGARKPIRFVVEIERGINTTRGELTDFLLDVYCNDNGWTRSGVVSFATAERRGPGITLVRLAGRAGVKQHCGRLLGDPDQASGNYSCASHAYNEIVLNNERWTNGAQDFSERGGTLNQYRTMVATHEMGHVLDLRHQLCRTDGKPAPVMMQQSISMTSESTGKSCSPNAWPLAEEIDRLRLRWS